MADMPDHEDDDLLGGGMLSQDELDALLAAASAETAAAEDGGWDEPGAGGGLPARARRGGAPGPSAAPEAASRRPLDLPAVRDGDPRELQPRPNPPASPASATSPWK